MRRGHEAVDDIGVGAGREQVDRVRGCEASQRKRVEPVEGSAGRRSGARRQEEGDGIVREPASGEQHGGRRLGIEPMEVVDDDEHWTLLGGTGEQRHRAGGHEVPVVGILRLAPVDGGLHGMVLPFGNPVEMVAKGSEELQETGVPDCGLRLHPARSQPLKPGSGHLRLIEQRRLADAGLPGDDERAGTAASGCFDHLLDPLELGPPPDHAHRRTPRIGGFPRGDERTTGGTLERCQTNQATSDERLSTLLRLIADGLTFTGWRMGLLFGRSPWTRQ